jgi:hypothetical protein
MGKRQQRKFDQTRPLRPALRPPGREISDSCRLYSFGSLAIAFKQLSLPLFTQRLLRRATGAAASLRYSPLLLLLISHAAALNQQAANPQRAILFRSVRCLPTPTARCTALLSCAWSLRSRMRLSLLLLCTRSREVTAFRIMRWRLRCSRDLLDLHVLHTIVRTHTLSHESSQEGEPACHMRAATRTDRRSNHELVPMSPSS